MSRYVCIDIGGTAVKYGLADEQGKLLDKGSMETRAQEGPQPLLEHIRELAAAYQSQQPVAGKTHEEGHGKSQRVRKLRPQVRLRPGEHAHVRERCGHAHQQEPDEAALHDPSGACAEARPAGSAANPVPVCSRTR